MSMRSARWLLAAATSSVVAVAGAAGTPVTKPKHIAPDAVQPEAIDPVAFRSGFGRHKVLVDAIRAAQVRSAKATQRFDYGAFQLIETDAATAEKLITQGIAQSADQQNLILLNAGVIDTTSPQAKASAAKGFSPGGKGMALVQFAGPIRPQWYAALEATGVQIVTAIPSNAYLVYGEAATLQRIVTMPQAVAPVQLALPYEDQHRLDPWVDPDGAQPVTVQLFAGDAIENAATIGLIGASADSALVRDDILNYTNVTFTPKAGTLRAIAARPDVVSIQRYVEPTLHDERQNRIISGFISGNTPQPGDYLAWLGSKGFTQAQFDASGFVVDVTDSGIDNGVPAPTTPPAPPAIPITNHFALHTGGVLSATSRVMYARLEGTPNVGSSTAGVDGHGTLNSSIVAGYVPAGGNFNALPHRDAAGYRYGLGVAPFVRVGSSTIFDPSNFTSPNVANLQSRAYRDNARISTNSWGAAVGGAYNAAAQSYDALVRDAQPATSAVPTAGNQEMVIVFSAGNAGPGASTIGSPGTGKNVFTVGASENVHPFGGADFCNIGDTGADSLNDIIGFSSRGPAAGGRRKPEIQAPGTHVTGMVWQAAAVDPTASPAPFGQAAAAFNAEGVCAGPQPSNFFPVTTPVQQWYTASSGTSHSAPAVAGGAALLRQFFINKGSAPPSPAMTKAVLMNTTRYMTGVSANDTLWSNSQGMGLMDLGRAFDTVGRVERDQLAADMFTATGQSRTFVAQTVSATEPTRVTVAWTDAPGPTSGAPQLNNLDLTVSIGGTVYKGNVFTGANSSAGGTADSANNVESVFVPAMPVGTPMVITVTAANIVADGVPNTGGALDQDFALVAYNAAAASIPVVQADNVALTAEGFTPPNNAPDPGEPVTYDLTLSNAGTADATNVVATLQNGGGVTAAPAGVSYGTLTAGGAGVTRAFPFTVDGALACGANVTATWNLTSGATNLGTVTRQFTTGTPAVGLTQNFDGVTAPALPAGWTAATTTGTPWRTVTTQAQSAPNSVSSDSPATPSDKSIVSPSFPVSSAQAEVTFSHRYALETGYDGVVLEIAIGGGAFADIVTAGGSFVSGGYNGTLDATTQNPIGGRAAWTGSFNTAWTSVTARLPASAAGQNVQLRWRFGSDVSVAATGYFLDNVSVVNGRDCAAPSGSVADLSVSIDNGVPNVQPGQAVTYTVVVSNDGPSTATGATFNLPLAAGLGNMTWTCAATGTGACNGASGSGAISNKLIDLGDNDTVTFTVNAIVDANATGTIAATANVAAPAGVTDLNGANNADTDTDPVVQNEVFSSGFENP